MSYLPENSIDENGNLLPGVLGDLIKELSDESRLKIFNEILMLAREDPACGRLYAGITSAIQGFKCTASDDSSCIFKVINKRDRQLEPFYVHHENSAHNQGVQPNQRLLPYHEVRSIHPEDGEPWLVSDMQNIEDSGLRAVVSENHAKIHFSNTIDQLEKSGSDYLIKVSIPEFACK